MISPILSAASFNHDLRKFRHFIPSPGIRLLWLWVVLFLGGLSLPGHAVNDLYWDTNGTLDGSGAATGTWGSSSFWTTDSLGQTDTFQTATGSTNDLHFSAGTNGTTGTVTISGTQFANGLYFEEGAVTLSGGTITLSDGAIINNTTGAIPTIAAALTTSGTVTLTGTRVWLKNPSFAGGGTLEVNTSNATLLQDGGALNGLATINLLSGGLDIRTSSNGYNYAAGTTLNFVNSTSLYTISVPSATWLGDAVVSSGKTATLSASSANNTFTIAGNISGAGNVSVGGSGTVVLSGTNTYQGITSVSAFTLQISNGSAIPDAGAVSMTTGSSTNTLDVQTSETIGVLSGGSAAFSVVNIADGQVLTLSRGSQTYSGTFSGTGGLAVAGASQTLASSVTLTNLSVAGGALTLAAANTITDGLTMSGGTVQLRDAGAAGSSAILASGGTLQAAVARGSSLTIANDITVSAGSHVILSPQTNGGSSGTATVNFAGTMNIQSGGILQLGAPGSNAAYGTANGAMTFAAGSIVGTKFQLAGNSFTVAGLSTDVGSPGSVVVENGSTTAATFTVALAASDTSSYAGTLRNGNTGTLALIVNGGTGSALTLASANTHSGNTSVTGGSLVLAHRFALQNSTVTTGSTGLVFDSSVAAHAFTLGGLSGSVDLVLEDNASNAVTLTIGNNGSSQTYSGALSGTGGLTKAGAGIQTFSTAHTYTGATTVNGGTLKLLFGAGTPTSDIIDSGSALILGGGTFLQQQTTSGPNSQTLNGVTVRAGSSVVNQTRVGGGTMLLTLGSLTREIGGTVAFSANGGGSSGLAASGTNTASGIIGGYATYYTTNGGANYTNGIDWATFSGDKIVALSSGAYSNTSATTAATNLNMTSSLALDANVTVGSVRFNNAITTPTLTLNGTHTIDSGGILVTGNVGANATLITDGALTSGNGQDLIVIQNNTSAVLTLEATITGAIGF
ncbi:MAG: autotransporter-associated beta strand repeat-containing protein, partial [Prosthecobacter sp.]